jgi:hypothetical protein
MTMQNSDTDWLQTCKQIIDDETNKALWKSHKQFSGFVFDHLDRYGKTRSGIARILRMVKAYQAMGEEFSNLNLPAMHLLPSGVKAMSFNDLSRLWRVLTPQDKERMAMQVAKGDLRSEHIKPLLQIYAHALAENSTRGRPSLKENPKALAKRPDPLVACISALNEFAQFKSATDRATLINLGMTTNEKDGTSQGSVPQAVWVQKPNDEHKSTKVIALYILIDEGTTDQSVIPAVELFDVTFVLATEDWTPPINDFALLGKKKISEIRGKQTLRIWNCLGQQNGLPARTVLQRVLAKVC